MNPNFPKVSTPECSGRICYLLEGSKFSDAEECAERPENLHPIIIAENLCPLALLKNIQRKEQKEQIERTSTSSAQFHRAWKSMDLALCHDDQTDRHRLIDFAQESFEELASDDNLDNPMIVASAMLGAIYAPIFRKRADSEPVHIEDIRSLHNEVGELFQILRDEFTEDIGMLTEMTTSLLLLRLHNSNYLPYPVSPREESSQDFKHFNHDFYTIDREVKVAGQVKRSASSKDHNYHSSVAMIVLRTLIHNSNNALTHKFAQQDINFERFSIDDVEQLLIQEAAGDQLDHQDRMILDDLSTRIVAEMNRARQESLSDNL